MTTTDTVSRYIVDNFARDLDYAAIPADADLHEIGIVNSLGIVRIVAWIGDEFDIPVAELDFDPKTLHTIAGIADFVDANKTA
ncbi:acyl carrier protein [Nocardia sp. alder85J]|uniref:acyl carrier protein n=1 Tax=Nocardia sp. alder85J TaxID=2862949 RepID=UPI001CD7FA7D|nr:acyl carrier protein [Nocardia sp. alder85J]MCX4096680.1 acyl carrier protein [Nocardia sp. alder85J]